MIKIVVWWDRYLRLWTAVYHDENGNQIGNSGYGPTKNLAIADLTQS